MLNYDAIMIDEGQDFDADWFKLVSELLNPDIKSLLLVEDRVQSIYKRGCLYLKETGLDFQAVFIVSANNIPFALEEDIEREASLLYIGMTRAKEYLCISYSGESEVTAYFDGVLEERKKEEGPDVIEQ